MSAIRFVTKKMVCWETNLIQCVLCMYCYLIFIARSMALCWSCTCLSAVSVFIESTVCTIGMNLLTSHKTWAWLCRPQKIQVGYCLSATSLICHLFQYGQITPQLAIKVLLQFDKSINTALATRVKSRLTFKVQYLFFFLILTAYSFRVCFSIILPSAPEFPKQ